MHAEPAARRELGDAVATDDLRAPAGELSASASPGRSERPDEGVADVPGRPLRSVFVSVADMLAATG